VIIVDSGLKFLLVSQRESNGRDCVEIRISTESGLDPIFSVSESCDLRDELIHILEAMSLPLQLIFVHYAQQLLHVDVLLRGLVTPFVFRNQVPLQHLEIRALLLKLQQNIIKHLGVSYMITK
jgi:hypothetical protein